MKNILIAAAVMFFSVTGVQLNAQQLQLQDGAVMTLDKDVHDYGEIEKGGDPFCEFLITNTGNEPLIISNAKGSCGCTVPTWEKEPIMPGESSVMTVKYDTKRVGPINKSVTITSNATNSPTKVIRIKGKVLPATVEETSPVKKATPGTPVNK